MKKTQFSLRKKTILFAVGIAIVVGLLAILIYYRGIQDVINSQYKARSLDIVNLVSLEIDSDRVLHVQTAVRDIYDQIEHKVKSDEWGSPAFDEYIANYAPVAEMEDYQTLLADLRRMQNVLDVNCLYIIWVDTKLRNWIYLIDADYEDPCPIGCIDPLYEENFEILENPEIGFPPYITNTEEYGWLITAALPIFGNHGKVIAYAAVDISMNDIMKQKARFLPYAALAFLIVTVMFCALAILVVNRSIIRPINKMSQAAERYTHDRRTFSELNICRNDEIGILADSMVTMEADINRYIENLEQTTNALTAAREHAEELDRIANVDPMTKVFNKRAFSVEALRLNESERSYSIVMIDMNNLKDINDTYGHEKGDISIITLARLICWTFRHSSIYRVGGDEFIAVLEGDDYAERGALLRSINDLFEKNQESTTLSPWERVTAAVGSADFTPGSGDTAAAVLKQADQAMYERKKEMKG